MKEGRKTLFELAPDKFVVPGNSKNGSEPLEDLVFKRDAKIAGLYRAKIEHADVNPKNGNGFKFRGITDKK